MDAVDGLDGRVNSTVSVSGLQAVTCALVQRDWQEALRLLQFEEVDVSLAEPSIGLQLPIHVALANSAPQQVVRLLPPRATKDRIICSRA